MAEGEADHSQRRDDLAMHMKSTELEDPPKCQGGPATAARRGPGVRRRYRPKKREVELPATYLLRLELEGGFGVLSTRANHGVKEFQKFQTFFRAESLKFQSAQ